MNIFRSHIILIMILVPIISAFGYTAVTIYNQEYCQGYCGEASDSSLNSQEIFLTRYPCAYQQELDNNQKDQANK